MRRTTTTVDVDETPMTDVAEQPATPAPPCPDLDEPDTDRGVPMRQPRRTRKTRTRQGATA